AADGQRELVGPLVDPRLELVEAQPTVRLGVAPAEHVEVHAIENDDLHRGTLQRLRRSADQTLELTAHLGGRALLDARPVGASARGSWARRGAGLIGSPMRFLSRSRACQARSGSPLTGFGSSMPSTAAVSRPDSRRAASSPSATASPWGRSKSAAASSAWANVCPRLRWRRGPWSCGARRQSADLDGAAPRASSSRRAGSWVLRRAALPCRRSRSGSVSSNVSSRTTRAGQWKAPTRFLPSGMSIPVLPPIPASTWPTSVVGTAAHGTPRR